MACGPARATEFYSTKLTVLRDDYRETSNNFNPRTEDSTFLEKSCRQLLGDGDMASKLNDALTKVNCNHTPISVPTLNTDYDYY